MPQSPGSPQGRKSLEGPGCGCPDRESVIIRRGMIAIVRPSDGRRRKKTQPCEGHGGAVLAEDRVAPREQPTISKGIKPTLSCQELSDIRTILILRFSKADAPSAKSAATRG